LRRLFEIRADPPPGAAEVRVLRPRHAGPHSPDAAEGGKGTLDVREQEGLDANGKGGGCPPPCVRLLYILNLRISEDPQTAVTVAAEDVREPVFSNERLHAPEVVAERVEVAAHFNELAGGVVGRV
jgi:hypothetical protein